MSIYKIKDVLTKKCKNLMSLQSAFYLILFFNFAESIWFLTHAIYYGVERCTFVYYGVGGGLFINDPDHQKDYCSERTILVDVCLLVIILLDLFGSCGVPCYACTEGYC